MMNWRCSFQTKNTEAKLRSLRHEGDKALRESYFEIDRIRCDNEQKLKIIAKLEKELADGSSGETKLSGATPDDSSSLHTSRDGTSATPRKYRDFYQPKSRRDATSVLIPTIAEKPRVVVGAGPANSDVEVPETGEEWSHDDSDHSYTDSLELEAMNEGCENRVDDDVASSLWNQEFPNQKIYFNRRGSMESSCGKETESTYSTMSYSLPFSDESFHDDDKAGFPSWIGFLKTKSSSFSARQGHTGHISPSSLGSASLASEDVAGINLICRELQLKLKSRNAAVESLHDAIALKEQFTLRPLRDQRDRLVLGLQSILQHGYDDTGGENIGVTSLSDLRTEKERLQSSVMLKQKKIANDQYLLQEVQDYEQYLLEELDKAKSEHRYDNAVDGSSTDEEEEEGEFEDFRTACASIPSSRTSAFERKRSGGESDSRDLPKHLHCKSFNARTA